MGLATVRAFAESGAAVALTDVNETALNAAAKELTDAGHRVLTLTCDVTDEDQVAAAIDRTVEAFGHRRTRYVTLTPLCRATILPESAGIGTKGSACRSPSCRRMRTRARIGQTARYRPFLSGR
ncbi:SDR family oxidoreductase [Nonomuraea zeae]|uniref:SDR family oxidoreductase n=1 Tax=Nonomuraea zeae TaxID=1642303 RepID=UPI0019800270